MTTEKYSNILRISRYSLCELRQMENDLYDAERTPERQMKLKAIECISRETLKQSNPYTK